MALDERWFKPARIDDVLAFEHFDGVSIAKRVLLALRS
jgi:hypothetical protein